MIYSHLSERGIRILLRVEREIRESSCQTSFFGWNSGATRVERMEIMLVMDRYLSTP